MIPFYTMEELFPVLVIVKTLLIGSYRKIGKLPGKKYCWEYKGRVVLVMTEIAPRLEYLIFIIIIVIKDSFAVMRYSFTLY